MYPKLNSYPIPHPSLKKKKSNTPSNYDHQWTSAVCFSGCLPILGSSSSVFLISQAQTWKSFSALFFPCSPHISLSADPDGSLSLVSFLALKIFIYLFGSVGSQSGHAGSFFPKLQHIGFLVAACRILFRTVWSPSCGTWDLVPRAGIEPGLLHPALGAQSATGNQGSPDSFFKNLSRIWPYLTISTTAPQSWLSFLRH